MVGRTPIAAHMENSLTNKIVELSWSDEVACISNAAHVERFSQQGCSEMSIKSSLTTKIAERSWSHEVPCIVIIDMWRTV